MADQDNVADNTGGISREDGVSTPNADVVITDKQLFDHAIAPDPAPAAEPKAPEPAPSAEPAQQQPPQQPAAGELPRDPQGRFAPKTGQQPPQRPQAAPQQQPQRTPEDHRVPLRELLDTRERAYKAEAEAHQMRQAWAQFQAQQQAAAQQQQAPQTIFDAPEDYLTQRVIEPLRQEMQLREMQRTEKQSREFANAQFGQRAVEAALADMTRIRYTPQGEVVYRQIMDAGHPYGALMQWHNHVRSQQQLAQVQQVIGPDPNAWLKQKQQEWVKDPNAQRAVLAELRQQQQASGRPPNVSLPPSLSSMPASSGRLDDQGDLSNESLYRFATK